MTERTAVVACSVMRLELEAVVGDRPVDVRYVEQGLHSTPKLMPQRIQEVVDEALAGGAGRVALGYGLCSNGIVGVSGGASPLVVPRCHDCIALLLGSARRYREVFNRYPGTFYLTAGWINECDDPLGAMEGKYTQRLGEKKARRAMELELRNYTHVCYIDNGLGDGEKLKARALENCRAFNKEYLEIKGSLDYFRALVDGPPHPEDDFITIGPDQRLTGDMFYDMPGDAVRKG